LQNRCDDDIPVQASPARGCFLYSAQIRWHVVFMTGLEGRLICVAVLMPKKRNQCLRVHFASVGKIFLNARR